MNGEVGKRIQHQIKKGESSEQLTTWLKPHDFKWILTGTSWITETQTFYIFGNDGSFILIQTAYSNLSYSTSS